MRDIFSTFDSRSHVVAFRSYFDQVAAYMVVVYLVELSESMNKVI